MNENSTQELDRIKHCLALSASANEHEAAAAVRQAQALMRKHRLSEADISLSDVGQSEGSTVNANRPKWDLMLANVVAEVFRCKAFSRTSYCQATLKKQVVLVFIGIKPAPEIAKYAYDTLYLMVSTARSEHIAKIRRGDLPVTKHSAETRGNHFAMAWLSVVYQQLNALVPELDESPEQADSNAKALALITSQENSLIEAYVSQITNGAAVGRARAIRTSKADRMDLLMGAMQGSKAEINHGVGKAGAETMSLEQENGQ